MIRNIKKSFTIIKGKIIMEKKIKEDRYE